MSQVIKFVKVVSALPGTLDNNTIYFVKSGFEVLAYVTNDLGMVVAYPLTVDLSSKADLVHEHAGEDITSGVVSADFLPDATTSAQGVVQLSTSVSSTSDTLASTPSAVKQAYDLANAAIPATEKGAANGVAPLGSDSKISSTYLPSYVDDVLEYASFAALPATGEVSKIYVVLDTNKIYRWSGTIYVEISPVAGNADTATALATARTISLSGDGTWSVSFDGSANAPGTFTLSNSGVSANTYKSVTVDTKGRVTAGTNPTTLSGFGITDAQKIITQSATAPSSPSVGDLWIDLS